MTRDSMTPKASSEPRPSDFPLPASKQVKIMKRKKDIARYLAVARRKRKEVSVGKLQKMGKPNESIVVPSKVLGSGFLEKKLDVYATAFSKTAKKKIEEAGGRALAISVLDSKKEVRIVV